MKNPVHPNLLNAAQLITLTTQPRLDRERYPPAQPLLIDTAVAAELDASQRQHVTQWLRQQPRPVIGCGDSDPDAASLFDTVAANSAELEAMLSTTTQCPQAAMVLVQTLRLTEHLPTTEALVVESMAYATLQSGAEFRRWLAAQSDTAIPAPQPPDTPAVLIERHGNTLRAVLNRPDNDNAMDVELRDALSELFQLVALDTDITAVDISARGPIFSSGGDLKEFGAVANPATAHQIRSEALPAIYLLTRADIVHFHLHRACIGAGIELPAFAGRVTAEPKTFFWLPEARMGLIPGAGGCVSLPRRIGRQRTAWLALTSKKISAKKALEWGLIDAIETREPLL